MMVALSKRSDSEGREGSEFARLDEQSLPTLVVWLSEPWK